MWWYGREAHGEKSLILKRVPEVKFRMLLLLSSQFSMEIKAKYCYYFLSVSRVAIRNSLRALETHPVIIQVARNHCETAIYRATASPLLKLRRLRAPEREGF